MGNRISQFDYIRVVALIGILTCHSLFETYGYGWFGRYLALTFNFVFLILSAILIGLGWEKKNHVAYDKSFVIRRVKKLSRTYYPYLAALFFFLYVTQDYFSWGKVASHVAYLSWFNSIDGFGHLWFMTMIVMCYAGCWIVSKIPQGKYNHKLLNCSLLIGGGILIDWVVTKYGLPGYMFPYLILYLIVFRNARIILEFIHRISFIINILQFTIINAIAIVLFHNGFYESQRFLAYLLGIICATSWICFLMNLCSKLPSLRIIVWLSGISFEVYLVHEFFLGRYSVYKYIDNGIVGFIALLCLSLISAFILKSIADVITRPHRILKRQRN